MSAVATQTARVSPPADILPTLFGQGYGNYQIRQSNFVISFVVHVLALLLLLISGIYITTHPVQFGQQASAVDLNISPIPLPPAATLAGGGGGGGDHDKLQTPTGAAPRFAAQQLAPPAMVIRNVEPKLPVEPTLIGPPDLKLPQPLAQLGDPLSNIVGPPSNGTGTGGGMGSGSGGGIGSGHGAGLGPGSGGGVGGGIYSVGGGVSAPKALYDPDPDYSEEARKAKYQGTVVLVVVIGPDGLVRDLNVQRSLGMGLDEKAVEAVKSWRFEPAKKEGKPVAVRVSVEVSFRLL